MRFNLLMRFKRQSLALLRGNQAESLAKEPLRYINCEVANKSGRRGLSLLAARSARLPKRRQAEQLPRRSPLCGHCSFLARARERRAASETLQGRSRMNSLARNQLSLPRHGRLSEAYCLGARGVTPRRCRDRAAAPARARSLAGGATQKLGACHRATRRVPKPLRIAVWRGALPKRSRASANRIRRHIRNRPL